MNTCRRILARRKLQNILAVVCFSLFLAATSAAKNNAFVINYLNIAQLENELRLDAEIDYQLNSEVKEALENGIPMLFQVEVQIKQLRKWRWGKTITDIKQTHMLKYHALSKQYIWENLDTGANDTFPDLDSALTHQGTITAMFIAETANLSQVGNYVVQLRSSLLTNKLPLPLRVKSYFSPKWQLSSGWHEWPL